MVVLLVVFAVCAGCARKDYRMWADRDAYRLLKTRQKDQRWVLPDRTVEPDPTSRLADVHDPDCGPVPPDDPNAQCYMRHPYRSKNVKYWDDRGDAGAIDSRNWEQYLPYNESGKIKLTQRDAIALALKHSREFQSQVEQLHVAALGLSENRYEFAMRWFGGSDADFDATNDGLNAQRDLNIGNRLGFGRNFASGGQLAVNLANSFVWQLGGGPNMNAAAGNLLVSLTQPLLRGAFHHVRTESLTQSERSLLYGVRDFASFRRSFYLDVVSRYLGILNQAQSIRIEEENLRNLRLNLAEHEELLTRELVSPIQVDQVFQSYQSGRLSVLNAKQGLEASLDAFKLQLGLPSRVEIELDESILKPFQLNSPEIAKLQQDAKELERSLMKYLPPEKAPQEFFDQTYAALERLSAQTRKLKPTVDEELKQWMEKLKQDEPTDSTTEDDRIEHQQQSTLAKRLEKSLGDFDDEIATFEKEFEEAKAEQAKTNDSKTTEAESPTEDDDAVDNDRPKTDFSDVFDGNKGSREEEAWKQLQFLIGRRLQDQISTLFVAQTQIRLFTIEIKPLDVESHRAVEIALENRLDLMNSKAQVVDSYRAVEIAANSLQSDLSVTGSANLRTDPNSDNPVRFDGKETTYNLGLQFDGPLDRMSERNAYRASQISYQQSRRNYMAVEDSISNEVRQDLRQLITNRFNFQISRQSLIAATRQVDEAQFNLRTSTAGDSSLTQDLLQALQGLRNAKNSLISSWVSYEISRIELFVDLELLMLDENGVWINEQENILTRATNSRGPTGNDEFDLIINEPDGERFDDRSFDSGIIDDDDRSEPVRKPQPQETLPVQPEFEPLIEAPLDPEANIDDGTAESSRRWGLGSR